MQVIVFAKTKGGVAASTLCYNVALMAALKSQVFLVDLDPQASLRKMFDARNELLNPRLIADIESLAKSVRLLTQAGYDRPYMFVDTPGSLMPVITDAIGAADLIVIPTQPSPLDLRAQDAIMDRIERMGLGGKVMHVLTRTQTNKPGIEAIDKATLYLAPRSPHATPTMAERIDYKRAAETGRAAWEIAKGKTRDEIKAEIGGIWQAMQAAMQTTASVTESASEQTTRH